MSLGIIHIAAYIGAGLSVGIASIGAGIGEGYTAGRASTAIMRQPKSGEHILRSMLISQAITETGAIFALVIGLLLIFSGSDGGGWFKFSAYLSAGLAVGIGNLGPGFSSGYTGGQAMSSAARQPKSENTITTNMLLGQALAQTNSIFALLVALLLIYSVPNQPESMAISEVIIRSMAYMTAGLCIGFGTIGPGAAIGYVAGRANDMIGRYPKQRGVLTKTMFLGAAVSQSTAIYALVVSFLLMFAI